MTLKDVQELIEDTNEKAKQAIEEVLKNDTGVKDYYVDVYFTPTEIEVHFVVYFYNRMSWTDAIYIEYSTLEEHGVKEAIKWELKCEYERVFKSYEKK